MNERMETNNPEATEALGEKLGREARSGQIYCLSGDLGSWQNGLYEGLCQWAWDYGACDQSYLCHCGMNTRADCPCINFVCTGISCEEEMEDTGYEEYFYGEGVCLVEWAELVKELIPADAVWITIEKDYTKDDDYRRITIRQEG